MTDGFKEFYDALAEFLKSETSLTDLIAPEVADLEQSCRELVEKVIEEPLKELVPEWLVEIPRDLIEKSAAFVFEKMNLPLSDSAKGQYRDLWSKYPSPEEFPPLKNGITLFLLALDQCKADPDGIRTIAGILGEADNIDSRCQPFKIDPFTNPKYSWDSLFLPFLDGVQTEQYCESKGFNTKRPQTEGHVLVGIER